MFPIGGMLKSEVRDLAKKADLATAEKRDSQGLCFIGKVDLPTFLQQQLKIKTGEIIEIDSNLERLKSYAQIPVDAEHVAALATPFVFEKSEGQKVGEHIGAHFYTIGQRKGLQIGGRPNPSFVLQIDTENNLIFTGQLETHQGLNRYALKINPEELHFVNPDYELEIGEQKEFDVRIRYRQPLQKATLIRKERGLYILFKEMQRGITSGQFAVWYKGDELVGSGVIA